MRAFRRSPGFTALAVLTIAIGVGANAAIFSVVNAALLRPLPYPRDDELVLVSSTVRSTKQILGDASPANFLDWRARNQSFTGMAALRPASFVWTSGDRPDRVAGAIVNTNYFDVLEIKPAIGRGFRAEDGRPGAARAAIISDAFWRDEFGARADVIGQPLRLNDEQYTVIGVMARGIDYPDRARVWVTPHWPVPDDPQAPTRDPSTDRDHGYLTVIARLKPGVSFAAARRDMDALALAMERDHPDSLRDTGISQMPLRGDMVGDVRSTMLFLFAAVGLLLLIAAANISGLLMARAAGRRQEIAVRSALGASRGRIVSQLLTESVLLALVGGATGLLLAMWLITPLVWLSPSDLTVAGEVTIDRTVLLFGLVTSGLVGLFFGLAPARHLSRVDLHDDLKQSARGSVSRAQRRARGALVTGEIALSLVLLVAAGLTVRSFARVQRVSMGFSTEQIMTVAIAAPPTRYTTQPERAEFWGRLLGGLQQVPGVRAVGAVSRLPLAPGNSSRGLSIPGLPDDAAASAYYRTASPDFFGVMGIPILAGRAFLDSDREDRPLVAIFSQAAARRFWPGRDPIGQRFKIRASGPDYTVVGVAGDIRATSLEAPPQPTLYVPFRQDAFPSMTFVLKTAVPAAALSNSVRAVVASVDRDQPVGALRTMDDVLSNSLTRRRFSVTLLTLFGAIAVVLAAVGLYGVLAYIVSQRRREIGVRIALGATPRDVITDVLGHGLRLAAAGIGIGIVLALAATRLITALLFATSPIDAATYIGAATLLTVIALTASLLPALRASRVDPLLALRDE